MEKSVWGNAHTLQTESIGLQGDTQGSETSQYLKEKKSTEIPQVVLKVGIKNYVLRWSFQ